MILLNERRQMQRSDASTEGALTNRTLPTFLLASLVNLGFRRSPSVFSRWVVHFDSEQAYSTGLLHTLNILASACIDTNLISRVYEQGDIDYGPGLQRRGLSNIVCCITAYARLGALHRQFQEIR